MIGKFTVSVIVSNHFGVLNRVSGLYAKRNYNIDSLAVGETENPAYSRITIVSTGDDYMKEQVVRQLEKLHDVKKVVLLDPENSVGVEHMLIKLKAEGEAKADISQLINDYGGSVMDFSSDFITAEITGSSKKIDSFIEAARPLGILELCRSGLIAMIQGTKNIMSVANLDPEE
ncbi:MAG: acetolactate synthase small subunit [Clostridiales bacterium]|jgi:acetolactate synthase-1/3 small subunit|nr:acetolactate synthase small subunit [Clostridiales bacterium]